LGILDIACAITPYLEIPIQLKLIQLLSGGEKPNAVIPH
jgi:hypothetical protein